MTTISLQLDEETFLQLFTEYVRKKEEEDTVSSLSIIFDRYEVGEGTVYEPALFFCPDWDIDFEARMSLTDALQDYLDDENNDDDSHRDLATRLMATIDTWKKEQHNE